jgi:lipopolysaccharide/colanic/teichoic acid biosynthesis glycosyltransferase
LTPVKRALDLGLVILMSVVLVPVGEVIALLLLVRQGPPVIFAAERMQTPDRAFRLLKFRTMTLVPNDSGVSGGDKAARITPMGRVLRRTRMDEVPQLWNVLKGDISLVGPRPPQRADVEAFPDLYAQVLKSRPGITGLATLYFHRHEEWLLDACTTPHQTAIVYARRCIPRKARLDLIYQRRRSLGMDLRLIGLTAARAFGLR